MSENLRLAETPQERDEIVALRDYFRRADQLNSYEGRTLRVAKSVRLCAMLEYDGVYMCVEADDGSVVGLRVDRGFLKRLKLDFERAERSVRAGLPYMSIHHKRAQ
jgi:hypothetical protein